MKIKDFNSNELPEVYEVLNSRQINLIWNYYNGHQAHIRDLLKMAEVAYPPSEPEDKNDPRIWKPEYWAWFVIMGVE